MNKNQSKLLVGSFLCALFLLIVACSEAINQPLNSNQTSAITWQDPSATEGSRSRVLIDAPIARISNPIVEPVINVGDVLYFSAENGLSQNGVIYRWDFDGAVKNPTVQIPGYIQFFKAGIYVVSLNTFNQNGVKSLSTDTVMLTVLASSVNQAPSGFILSPLLSPLVSPLSSPSIDFKISTGDSIDFMGYVTDPENNIPFTYSWNFDNGAPNSKLLNPGMTTFNNAGTYKVSFVATDAFGQVDTNPPSYFVKVNDITINAAHLPTGTITAPAMDMTINIGDGVDFAGLGESLDGNVPFTYLWNFGGASAPDSTMDIPGLILFDMAGMYTVTFTVTDSLMQVDPVPPQVIITVVDPAAPAPTPSEMPTGMITAPETDVTIVAGDAVDFMGMGASPVANDPVTFLWTFGDGAPDFMDQNPGMVTFDTEGVYEVVLTVTDSLGNVDPMPPMMTVTVGAAAPPVVRPPESPIGEILLPAMDMSIIVGDAIEFGGMGSSPLANDPVTYLWDFGGGAPEFLDQNPGQVTFAMEGTFEIILTVTDSLGVADSFPPSIIVTVNPVAGTPQPGDEPVGEIKSPDENITVTAGDTVNFEGGGESPIESDLTFLWNFGGAAEDVASKDADEVLFDMAGIYTVTLTVTDELGVSDIAPPTVEITVE